MTNSVRNALTILGLAVVTLSNAYAADRLFPTDILAQGEIDARLSVSHDTNSSNISFKGHSGKSTLELEKEVLQARYGLGSNWHVGISLPYASRSVVDTDFDNPSTHYSNKSGQGGLNPNLWATYGLINDTASRLTLNVEMLISPDTTGKVETSYTGRITAGWKNSDTLKFYGSFDATTFAGSNLANHYSVRAGAYTGLTETLTLIPYLTYVRYEGTNSMSAWDQYGIGLSANVRLSANSYLVPNVAFYRNGDSSSSDGFFHREASSNGKAFMLGFYHLF